MENLISRGQKSITHFRKKKMTSAASFLPMSLEQLLGSRALFLMMEAVFSSTACIWFY